MTAGDGKRADGAQGEGAGRAAGDPPAGSGGRTGASRRRGKRGPAPERSLEEKVDDLHHQLVSRRGAELLGILEIISSRRRLMWLNFNAGLARGVGFFLGVTMIGALVLGAVALAFNAAAHTLGFTDITLEQAVTSSVRRFAEIRELVSEAQTEVERETRHQQARAVGSEPDPGAPELQLPGAKSKGFK